MICPADILFFSSNTTYFVYKFNAHKIKSATCLLTINYTLYTKIFNKRNHPQGMNLVDFLSYLIKTFEPFNLQLKILIYTKSFILMF